MARRTRKPTAASGAPSVGQYVCNLCRKGFSRRSTVKDPHFNTCVRKLGNPDNLPWDSHPTCWVKRTDGSSGPSGTFPPGKPYNIEADRTVDLPEDPSISSAIATCYKEHKPSTALSTLLENRSLAIGRQMEPDMESCTPGLTPQLPYRTLQTNTDAIEPPSPNQLPSFRSLQLPEVKPRISSLKMNQMASAVMGMSREQAGKSDEDTLRKPEDVHTSIEQPKPGASEKEKQQAVVWLAQDVYKGRFLVDVEGRLSDQLKVVAKFRDLAMILEGMEGMEKIHEMLVAELGEHALPWLPL
ncbi:MAG: hypothetical protein Q9226_000288 [Calogaya cf. arnoldii]